jgi:hypothetical protein
LEKNTMKNRKRPETRRSRPAGGLGPAPAHFTERQRGIWYEMAEDVPLWLQTWDRREDFEGLVLFMAQRPTRPFTEAERLELQVLYGYFQLAPEINRFLKGSDHE